VFELKIDTIDMLKRAVNCVFEKALSEPVFSPTYAEFCVKLSKHITVTNADGEAQSFKRLILNQCQTEFESAEFDKAESNQETTEELAAEEKAAAFKKKQRMLGTIRFIGELFIRQMLTGKIIGICISMLFNTTAEENLEALCKLLRTVGKTLDKKGAPPELYPKLGEMSKDRKLPSRLRFMLQDVLDLRKAGWVDRLGTDKAKKLSEIHKDSGSDDKKRKDAEDRRQKQRQDDERRRGAPPPMRPVSKKDRYSLAKGSKTPTKAGTPTADDDGFMAAPLRKGGPRVRGKPAQKPAKLNPATPRGGVRSASNTPRKQTKNVKQDEQTKRQLMPPPTAGGFGGFAALGGSDDDEKEASESESDDVSDMSDDSSDDDEEGESKEEESSISEEDAQKKIKSLVREYFTAMDIKEAQLCVTELGTKKYHHEIVLQGLNLAVDGKQSDRDGLNKLLMLFAKELKILNSKHFEQGFTSLLEFADDMIIDLPLLLDHVAATMVPLIVGGFMSLAYLKCEGINKPMSPRRLKKFAEKVLKGVETATSPETVAKMVKEAELDEFLTLQGLDTIGL